MDSDICLKHITIIQTPHTYLTLFLCSSFIHLIHCYFIPKQSLDIADKKVGSGNTTVAKSVTVTGAPSPCRHLLPLYLFLIYIFHTICMRLCHSNFFTCRITTNKFILTNIDSIPPVCLNQSINDNHSVFSLIWCICSYYLVFTTFSSLVKVCIFLLKKMNYLYQSCISCLKSYFTKFFKTI